MEQTPNLELDLFEDEDPPDFRLINPSLQKLDDEVAKKYEVPADGIEKATLSTAVRTSLNKADAAVRTVNGQTPNNNGNVEIEAGVASVNGRDGEVTGLAEQSALNDEIEARELADLDLATQIESLEPGYVPPVGGVPYEDLAVDVQNSLDAADTSAQLDEDGKLPPSVVPAIALVSFVPVANEAAMLALSAQPGDGVRRTDNGKAYVLAAGGVSTELEDWLQISGDGDVIAVNGRTGDVTGLAEQTALASEITRATNAEGTLAAAVAGKVSTVNGRVPSSGDVTVPVTKVYTNSEDVKTGDIRIYSGAAYTANGNFNTGTGGFNGNNWTPLPAVSTPTAGTLVAAENFAPGGNTGLFARSSASRVSYRNSKRMFVWDALADMTMVKESGTGTQAHTEKTSAPDPLIYDRYVEADTGGGSNLVRWTSGAIGPFDLTDKILRFPLRVSSNFATAVVSTSFKMRLSSTGSFTTDYIELNLLKAADKNCPFDGEFHWVSFPIEAFTVVGNGADLSAINAWQVRAQSQGGLSMQFSIPWLDVYPKANNKAKCVLWFDDGGEVHWTTAAKKLAAYGFPAVLALNIANVGVDGTLFSIDELKVLHDFHMYQVATHAYSNPEHTATTSSDQLAQQFMRSRVLQNVHGLYGGDDLAQWAGLGTTGFDYDRSRQMFRSCRMFTVNERSPETLPPGDPWRMRAFGTSTSETFADWQPYVDAAIAQKGLAQLVWHNALLGTEFDDLLAYLDANRDVIDVVTIDDVFRTMAPNPGNTGDFGGNHISNALVTSKTVTTGYETGTADSLQLLRADSASEVSIICDPTAEKDTSVSGLQEGAGKFVFSSTGAGDVVHPSDHIRSNGPNSMVSLYVKSNTTGSNAQWVLSGNTSA